MRKSVLIDTSALVAALRRRDQYHLWARAHFEAQTEPFVTCDAVISESFFLMERAREGKAALSGLLERGPGSRARAPGLVLRAQVLTPPLAL